MNLQSECTDIPRERSLVELPKYYRCDGNLNNGIFIEAFPVMKKTKRGVWIALRFEERNRFVLNTARKRYAWPTVDEAIDSFLARKKQQYRILKAQLKRVEQVRNLVTNRRDELKERSYLHVPNE